jgi:hypothetical protein
MNKTVMWIIGGVGWVVALGGIWVLIRSGAARDRAEREALHEYLLRLYDRGGEG